MLISITESPSPGQDPEIPLYPRKGMQGYYLPPIHLLIERYSLHSREWTRVPLLVVISICTASCRLLLGQVVLEVRVIARLFRRYTSGGVVDKHHLQEVKALVVKAVAKHSVHITQPLGER